MRLQEILLVSVLVFSQSALNFAFANTPDNSSVPKEESSSQRASLSKKEQKQKNAELIKAIKKKDVKDVQKLLKEGADPNARGKLMTALNIAIEVRSLGSIDLLLEAGAENEGAELIGAIKSEDVKAVQQLLHRGANPDDRETEKLKTAVMVAIEVGNPEIVDLLLKAGVRVNNVKSFYGSSVIQTAIAKGDLGILEKVLEAGAGKDTSDWEVMVQAIFYGSLDTKIVKKLISKRGIEYLSNDRDILGRAIRKKNPIAVELLLEAGIGFKPMAEEILNEAVKSGNIKIMKLILGRVAFKHAFRYKFKNFPVYFVEQLMKIKMDGKSALISAVELGNAEALKLLLDKGADPTEIMIENESLRDYAHRKGQTEIVEIFDAKFPALSSACSAAFGGSK